MGQLCFTWSSGQDGAGGDVPVLKIAVGRSLREGEALRDLGGTPHSSSSCWAPKCGSYTTDSKHSDLRSWGHQIHSPLLTPEVGKGLACPGSRETVTNGKAVFLLRLPGWQQARQGFLSLPLGVRRPGNSQSDVVRLPDCRPAGEESPVGLP